MELHLQKDYVKKQIEETIQKQENGVKNLESAINNLVKHLTRRMIDKGQFSCSIKLTKPVDGHTKLEHLQALQFRFQQLGYACDWDEDFVFTVYAD